MPEITEEDIRNWADKALKYGGSFVRAIACTIIAADDSNFQLIRPVVLQLMQKYPKYSSEVVPNE